MHLSVIIPAYNEEKRIGATLNRIYDYLSTKKYDYEVIVVNDGSIDGTTRELDKSKLAKACKLIEIKNGINKGKGFSVKNGILHSAGEYALFSDADLSTPIEELDGFFDCIKDGYDIVIGSRALKDSNIKIRQAWYREIMGKAFNLIIKWLLFKDFNDTQCGFKLFRGHVARDIAASMKIKGFCFDVEMLYLAKIKGYNIKEKGVLWNNSAESKVRLLHSSAEMFLDLFRIRVLHRRKEG